MAHIETWCRDGRLKTEVVAPEFERRIVIRVSGEDHQGCLRMTCEEAVALRDDLSRAILEAAQASAKAKAAESQGSPA
ncbi:MAG: hypothetical protein ACTHMO_05490 [Rhodanobacteraceae bacterium]